MVDGTPDNPVAPDVPFGIISVIVGLLSLMITIFGCLLGFQWFGVPFGVMGIGAAVVGRFRIADSKTESIDLIIWGLVLNTLAIAINVLLFAFCAVFFGTYFVGAVIALLAL